MEKNVQQDGGHQNYNIEALLKDGHTVQLTPQGTSMYPMFADAHDQAVIAPLGGRTVRRGDVVLYRRSDGRLVLHRVSRRTAEGCYDMVGDNQSEIERSVQPQQLLGVLVAWQRRGRMRSVKNIGYRMAAGLWLWMLPFRAPIHRMLARVRGLGKK